MSKNKSVELYASPLQISFSLYSFLLWTEVLLEFLALLVSGDRATNKGQDFSIFVPLPSPLRYNNNDPSCHIFSPSPKPLWLTHFWKKVVGKSFQTKVLTVFNQEGSCLFPFLLIGLVLEFWTPSKTFSERLDGFAVTSSKYSIEGQRKDTFLYYYFFWMCHKMNT